MTQILRQSTAVDVLIGPFLDSGDAYTAETGLSPAVKISKNGQALAAKSDVTVPVHDADGYYNCELDATDTNTVGTIVLTVAGSATHLPVRHEFQVIEEATYDYLYAAGATPIADINAECDTALSDYGAVVPADLPANFADLAITASTGRVTVGTNNDKTGYSLSGTKTTLDALNDVSGVDVQTQCNNAIIFNDLDHLVHVAYDPASKPGNAAGLLNILVENDGGVPRFTTNSLENGPASGGDSAAAIADAIWDEAISGHVTADTFGEHIQTQLAAIVADTNELQTDDIPSLIGALNDPSLSEIQSVIPQLADIMQAPLAESYASSGEQPNLTQAVLAIMQMLMQFRIVGNTLTVYKIDGVTPAFTVQLDSPTSPTSAMRT